MSRHGTRPHYRTGCACVPCRAANAAYVAARRQARAHHDPDPLVSAAPVRAHLRTLSAAGFGARQVATLAGLTRAHVLRLRTGHVRAVRPATAAAILAVTGAACLPGRLVSAAATWALIARLEQDGFTRADLARRLHLQGRALPFGTVRVRVATANRVRQLFHRLTVE